ncbi:hypothetical protein M422DRAFT_23458 [Sphaerobolus stellatus SS14]|nr:hypothetical protein M422DRAFT_23458 [Sphaerobolus stellatus SS14]
MASNDSATGMYSTSQDAEIQVQMAESFFLNSVVTRCIEISSLALLFYDTLLTLGDEVLLIWKRKWRIGTVLYLMARYCTMIELAIGLISQLQHPFTPMFCSDAVVFVQAAFNILGAIGVQGLLLGRAHTVSRSNQWSTMILCVLFTAYTTVFLVQLPFMTCSTPQRDHLILASLESISVVLSDSVVFFLTAYYAWKEYSFPWDICPAGQGSLLELFMQQGVIRFLIMFIWNVELAITEKIVKGPLAGVDSPLYIVVSVIFMCRFLLQIREFGDLRLDSAFNTMGLARNPSRSLSMFQAAMRKISDSLSGNLGAALSAVDDGNGDGRTS